MGVLKKISITHIILILVIITSIYSIVNFYFKQQRTKRRFKIGKKVANYIENMYTENNPRIENMYTENNPRIDQGKYMH
jgi:hypothetical protein